MRWDPATCPNIGVVGRNMLGKPAQSYMWVGGKPGHSDDDQLHDTHHSG